MEIRVLSLNGADDMPAEDLALIKQMKENTERIAKHHYDALDDAITLMMLAHGGPRAVRAATSRWKRYARFRMRHYHIDYKKILGSSEMRTIVSLEYKGKKIDERTVIDKLVDESGKCLSCGKKH